MNASIDYGNLTMTRSITIRHREVKSAYQSDGCLEVFFIDGSVLKIFVYKNELIYDNYIGLYFRCKVDLSRRTDILKLPPELKAKLEIIYPHLNLQERPRDRK